MAENVKPNKFSYNVIKNDNLGINNDKQTKYSSYQNKKKYQFSTWNENQTKLWKDGYINRNPWVENKKKKGRSQDLNPTEKKNLNKSEALEDTTTKSKVIRLKKRRIRRDMQLGISEKIVLKRVPQNIIPKDLFQVLKKNAQSYPGISPEGNKWVNIIKSLPEMNEIKETDYLTTLQNLLYLENYYQGVAMEQFNLKKTIIYLSKYTSNEYVIRVPSLVENNPPLIRGDTLKVVEIQSQQKYILRVTYVGEKYINVTAPTGFKNTYKNSNRYNVYFFVTNWSIRVCHFAIDLIRSRNLNPLLHPQRRIVCSSSKENSTFSWFNQSIESNPEQMDAVKKIFERTAYPSPYLLFGPPGTGKTATIVEAILQIWCNDTRNRILVCTPSNTAADEITKRLLINVPEYLIYRMISASIDGRDVDKDIRGCSHFIKNEAYMLPPEDIQEKKIVVTTLITCVRLVRMNMRPNHFNYIFIDESGQATQPETLIPMCLIHNDSIGQNENFKTQVVLSGDPKQLGPVVMTKIGQDFLGKSMLERFMDLFEIYQRDENNKYDPNFITQLVKNYRSHETILHIPNQMFYDNKLTSCGGEWIKKGENWSGLPNKNFPIIFHVVNNGIEERDKQSPSVCNRHEVEIVMNYVSKLLKETLGGRKIEQEDIGIITPFRFQGLIITKALAKKKWNDISVGTVDIFQGQEKDIIIVSTVRSALFQHNGKFHIGFLSHEKRFNVTITRAKSLLIVVGNPKVLQISNCWLNFIKYCQENKACVGDRLNLCNLTEAEMIILANNRLQAKLEKKRSLSFKVKTREIEKKEEDPCTLVDFDSGTFSISDNSLSRSLIIEEIENQFEEYLTLKDKKIEI